VPYRPAWIGIQGDSLWTTNGISLERVSLEDGSSLGSLKSPPRFQTARRVGAFGSLWAETDVSVVRIDPATMTVVAEVLIPLGPRYANWLSDISPSSDGIWTLSHEPSGEGYAVRIDPTTNTIVDRVAVGKDARSLAFADGSLWVIHAHEISMEGTVTRYDVAGTQLAEFGIAFNASIVVGNEHGVWVQGQAIDGSQANWVVARIDPKTNRLMTTYEVDPGPDWYGTANYDTVVGEGYAWVITKSNVVKIDETTGDVAAVYSGVAGGGVAVSDTDVWVADSGGKKLYRIPLEAGV